MSLPWDLRVAWAARPDWSLADGADRLAQSMRAIHRVVPEESTGYRAGSSAKLPVLGIDDPGTPEALVKVLRATRNKNLFKAGDDRFGDAHKLFFAAGKDRFTVKVDQVATGAGWATGNFILGYEYSDGPLLAQDPDAVTGLMVELAEIWEARNAWVDMIHVRKWQRWSEKLPVFGWATWLDPAFGTVDTAGLEVTATSAGRGQLIVLSGIDPAAMADPDGTAGRAEILQLAARTTLGDGRKLIDANERLRAELTAG